MKIKKGEIEIESDVETVVQNIAIEGLKQNERTWKDKFVAKHEAKKEMFELKHEQRVELGEQRGNKKNWFQKIEEEKRKTKELEMRFKLEEEIRREEEEKRILNEKKNISIVLGIVGSILLILGYGLSSNSANENTIWEGVLVVGFLILISIPFIWKEKDGKNKKK